MKFLPSRQKQKSGRPPVMVADLDALLTEKVSFRLLGKVWTIEPFSVEQFAMFSKAYFDLTQLSKNDRVVSPDELAEAYEKMTEAAGLSLTKEDIKKMSQQQAAALFQLLTDMHTGHLFADEKKTQEKVQTLLSMST